MKLKTHGLSIAKLKNAISKHSEPIEIQTRSILSHYFPTTFGLPEREENQIPGEIGAGRARASGGLLRFTKKSPSSIETSRGELPPHPPGLDFRAFLASRRSEVFVGLRTTIINLFINP